MKYLLILFPILSSCVTLETVKWYPIVVPVNSCIANGQTFSKCPPAVFVGCKIKLN